MDGCSDWALATLRLHASDPREYIYNRQQLDAATTKDALWNAAQTQLKREGKLHVRMATFNLRIFSLYI